MSSTILKRPESEAGIWKRQLAAENLAFAGHGLGGSPEQMETKAMVASAEADQVLSLFDVPPDMRDRASGGETRLALQEARQHVTYPGAAPDLITLDASRHRLSLATEAGVLPLAISTAESVSASDEVQQMLAHQVATTHSLGMRLTARSSRALEKAALDSPGSLYMAEAIRSMNASARMFKTCQEAAQTLNRLKTAGKQTMVVQHVHVSGGQALVAGAVDRREGAGQGGQSHD